MGKTYRKNVTSISLPSSRRNYYRKMDKNIFKSARCANRSNKELDAHNFINYKHYDYNIINGGSINDSYNLPNIRALHNTNLKDVILHYNENIMMNHKDVHDPTNCLWSLVELLHNIKHPIYKRYLQATLKQIARRQHAKEFRGHNRQDRTDKYFVHHPNDYIYIGPHYYYHSIKDNKQDRSVYLWDYNLQTYSDVLDNSLDNINNVYGHMDDDDDYYYQYSMCDNDNWSNYSYGSVEIFISSRTETNHISTYVNYINTNKQLNYLLKELCNKFGKEKITKLIDQMP